MSHRNRLLNIKYTKKSLAINYNTRINKLYYNDRLSYITIYLSPLDKSGKLSGCEQCQVSRTHGGYITEMCETHHLIDFVVQQRLVGQHVHNAHVFSAVFPNVKTFCGSN